MEILVALIIGVLQVLVTALGLSLVVRQLRIAANQARNQSYQAIYSQIQPIDIFLIQSPRIRALLYNNKFEPERLEVETRHQIEGVCETLCTTLENVVKQSTNAEDDIMQGWENYISDLYKESAALRWYIAQRGEWYSTDLRSLMMSGDGSAEVVSSQRNGL